MIPFIKQSQNKKNFLIENRSVLPEVRTGKKLRLKEIARRGYKDGTGMYSDYGGDDTHLHM